MLQEHFSRIDWSDATDDQQTKKDYQDEGLSFPVFRQAYYHGFAFLTSFPQYVKCTKVASEDRT
jgi:hypothetical protein